MSNESEVSGDQSYPSESPAPGSNASEAESIMDPPCDASRASRRSWLSHIDRRFQDGWLWEISGIALSISCMMAIFIILPLLDDAPLENWRFAIAPNTLISTFITVSKTSMLLAVAAGMSQLKWHHFQDGPPRSLQELDVFDEASRGPWGAMAFLWRMRRRGATVAAMVGAFVMLSSLTMDPLAQQIIAFRTKYVPRDDSMAWITISMSYDNSKSGTATSSFDFQSSIVASLIDLPLSFTYSCATGNCTWPVFTTLGVCSSCRNVTAETTDERIVLQAVDPSKNESGTDAVRHLYRTPGGVFLNATAPWRIKTSLGGVGATYESGYGDILVGNISDAYLTEQEGDIDQHITTIAVANMSTFSEPDRIPSAWDPVGSFGSPSFVYKADVDIVECDLRWCLKTFRDVKVENGTMADYSTNETDLIKDDNLSTTGHASSIPDHYFVMYASPGNAAAISPERSFTVRLIDGVPIKAFLRDFFVFTLTEYMETREPSAFNTGLSLLTRAGGTSATVASVAHALTLRTLVGPNSTRHAGTALAPEIYVDVRWPWIVFPALLLAAGAAFLAASMAVGRRKKGRGWKAGLMPLLFHGVSGWDGDAVGGMEGRREMDDLAREVRARLMRDEVGNLMFVKAKME